MNISFTSNEKPTAFLPLSFVFVGRFTPQKNIFKSLDFIYELKKLGKQVSFDLYGRDDGSLADLKEYVIELNISDVVTFRGSLLPTEIEIEMQKYNFYLQTSLVEGMAISVFQSIKNGLFAVVTPVGEIKNYTRDYQNACYVDVDNIQETTQKFLDVVSQKNNDLLKVGLLVNKKDYPQFDELFFSTLKGINFE
ncbi:glycosyltransferase [Pseudoalteromonas sp. FUC4]|uniref:glycosyltransferase n=1 Tax=Pseudoalteromonas sp. FUC4 TaxID=2511201 RepID=UPI00165E718C|nr:glycosyltransferase [Pseudoalteromonas sp. FUC4]